MPESLVQPAAPGLSVTMASPEVAPFAKTGGLGEAVSSLSRALEQIGLRVSVIMPAYRSILRGGFSLEDTGIRFIVPISDRQEAGVLLKTKMGSGIPVYLIAADEYFDRDYLYGNRKGDYLDNAERFVFFARATLEVLKQDPTSILHAHDWQSAMAITFLKSQPHLYPEIASVKTLFTVHNLGYQGQFWHLDWHLLNLDQNLFTPRYLEFYGKINFLKGGIVFADSITTVSPTYAEEIKTREQGFGLDGVFRERAGSLVGILNGVDYNVWDPSNDPLISRPYGPSALTGKKACKSDLQCRLSLQENPSIPLIGMVSRLTTQKGFDLLEKALDDLLSRDLQIALLGTGDSHYEDFFRRASLRYRGKMAVQFAFDDSLAHKVIAGADILLMPSLYEPCGLTQMYGLKYGTIPVVRATGGLKDTVREFDPRSAKGDGFVFSGYDVQDLLRTVDRALKLFPMKTWQTLVENAMAVEFSWSRSAQTYLGLYRRLVRS